ncbi:hypothetical protein [Nitrosomonas sp.]|uniref:hypothetical protein n=1 Tax=Nitrosomonas sp. TaxID=42353 RepID=UPI0025FD8159|nr:hypothetical protein [Nitrosomonas sp.]
MSSGSRADKDRAGNAPGQLRGTRNRPCGWRQAGFVVTGDPDSMEVISGHNGPQQLQVLFPDGADLSGLRAKNLRAEWVRQYVTLFLPLRG